MKRAWGGMAGAVVTLWTAACLSERTEVTGLPDDLDCAIPVDSLTTGNIGVVVMKDLAFHPSELRVRAGTRVMWINCETGTAAMVHSATADDGAWSSTLLTAGGVYSEVFSQSGTEEYHCEPHPFMRAVIIVE